MRLGARIASSRATKLMTQNHIELNQGEEIMKHLCTTLSGLLLGLAAITATAAPSTAPTSPNAMPNSTAPNSTMPNSTMPNRSVPPHGTTHCPPSSFPMTPPPAGATHTPPQPRTTAPGQTTNMPPCG